MGRGGEIIGRLARAEGLFRERDIKKQNLSTSCLTEAGVRLLMVRPHGHGVWSHRDYEPTRYELLQIRVENAVFWGPSALWLQGATRKEPAELWIAIDHKARRPRNLPLDTVIVRSRNLEKDLDMVPHGVTPLRVHTRKRAEADLARSDCAALLARALAPRRFILPPTAEHLSEKLASRSSWKPPHAPPAEYAYTERELREEWSVVRSIPASLPAPSLRYRLFRE
jgi:hypothetical protein